MLKFFHVFVISFLLSFSYVHYANAQGDKLLSNENISKIKSDNFKPKLKKIKKNPLYRPITSGYVLTHEHPTEAMAFGGNYAFTGTSGNYKNGIMENGYTASCGGCKALGNCSHGEVKGSFTAALGSLGMDMGDHKSYMGPLSNSNSHVRYSTEWTYDVFAPKEDKYKDTNMKIMVAFAVENNAMCEQLYYVNKGNGGPGGEGYACNISDSFSSLKRQLDNIKAWAKDNSSWMQIAYSAKQARKIINKGKLAVILGIESEYSFGAENETFDPVDRLNRYYNEGVRTFYLAHKFNSRLSGADLFLPKNSKGGKAIRTSQAISGCFHYDDNVGKFELKNKLGHNFCNNYDKCGANAFKGAKIIGGLAGAVVGGASGAVVGQTLLGDNCNYKFSDISEVNFADYVLGRGSNTFNGFNIYPLPPGFVNDTKGGTYMDGSIERNNLGLSHDGERVVREAMLKGMIVNIDHVSSRARTNIYDIATKSFDNYPLNALHNKPNHMLSDSWGLGVHKHDARKHEYDFDNGELDYIKNTGGFFGYRMGPTDSINYDESGVEDNCPNTSTETAKMLAWLLDYGMSVGYALDYATVTEGVHSRTLEKCRLKNRENVDVLHKYKGHVTEGLSHIGMMKKWHKELEDIGLKGQYLDQLKNNGVEQFIKMWEKSEVAANSGEQIERIVFAPDFGSKCEEKSDCGSNEYCARSGVDPRNNVCKTFKPKGQVCTRNKQCLSNRCTITCQAADECQANSDCSSNEFCGDPIAGKRSCKALKSRGELCSNKRQCSSNRCRVTCLAVDECVSNSDCSSNEFCGDPIAGKRSCKALKSRGELCSNKRQCSSNRCRVTCLAVDECVSNSDCNSNQRCGDPIAGKRKCKDLLANGKACTKKSQCASGRCSLFKCKAP